MIDKEQAKKEFNTKSQMIIIAIVVFCVSIILFSVITWFLKKLDTKENDKDPKNAPAAARTYMNSTNIDGNGKITLGKSISEWWQELVNSGNKITKYLNSPEELAKIMNAAMALEYPDTRENPDAPIDWNKIDINSKEIQGIVKFKRALKDGGDPISMTYVSPSKFQELISDYNKADDDDDARQKALEEVLKHFTIEKSYENSSNGGSPIVEEALKFACSWVGKVTYKSHASGDGDNGERFLPLKEGRGSDCSHFVHWVFEHVGLMDKDNFIHSLDWGNGGDNGGCPGTVRIGTDLSKASPGDVIWWHFGDAWNNHVAIYLGNEKMVECAAGANGVVISKITQDSNFDQILHFSQLPTDPTGYFDPNTMTLHSSISGNSGNSGNVANVSSLNGMVFIGDSIMYCLAEKDDTLKQEGAKYIYRGGSTAKYFLGKETASGSTNNCIENNGYFNWDANFKDITNPTGFYLVLGQNFSNANDRIEQMDELIKKIRSKYPTPPIYISSVLHNLVDSGSEENATKMNEELKVYCASQNNVYYSDILRGYNDNLEAMTESDNDHPNPQGSKLLVKNIKENIVSQNYMDISNDEEILKITAIDFRAIPNSGWGDGIMLSSNGYNLLMDTFREACRESLDKYLRENNITKFDIYISHDHHDHVDNLYHLIDNYNVSKVYIPNLDGFGLFSVNKLKEKGVEVVPLEKGDTFEIGSQNCVAEVIYGPDKTPGVSTNNMSLVTMIRTKTRNGEVKYLTGGDIEEYAANKILEQGIDIKADIMKADHHGGGDTPNYIKKVNPSFYLIDYLDKYDSWVQPQVDAAEECGNVFSTYNNGEVSFSIKASGNIVPTAQRNVEQVQFNVQDASGKTYIVTYTLNKDSSHILTDRMKAAVTNKTTDSTLKDTYKVKVATWNESEDIMDAEDPAVSDYHNHSYNITTTTIPYQSIVGKFKMPFNYLWTMLVYSQDKDYVFDLAKLVDNSKIEITIHDNYTETTNVVTDKYTKYKKAYTTAKANVDYKYIDIQTITDTTTLIPTTKSIEIDKSDSTSVSVDAVKIDEPSYTNVHTTIYRNNSLDIALTLADSWFAKYTKEYKYNGLTKNSPPPNTSKLDDIWNDPEEVEGDYAGKKGELTDKAENKAIEIGRDKHGSAFDADVNFYDVKTEYTSGTINRSTTTKNTVESSSYISSVPGGGGISLGTSISNVKTGSLNENNYIELPSPKTDGDGNNPTQGFCIVEDSMMAYVIHHYSTGTNTLFLVDSNTTQEYDRTSGFTGHGNTIAYDPVNAEIIFPEDGVIQLVKVNKATKKFEGRRSISPPQRVNSPSQMAYNAAHDLFIANSHVYTREAFYSGGEPIKDLEFEMLEDNDLTAGSTSYGNHVYYYFADWYGHSTNYLVVCDLNTGGQVELIRDNMAREGEEASFSSDGTLYLFHGEAGSPFHKTDYNYFYDTNIDTSNVTPGVGRAANDIARYNTGGVYEEKTSFKTVFNKHYNARSNILSIKEWLFKALEQNSDTVNMIDITKYLISRATGAKENRETFLAAIEKLQEGFTDMAEAGGKSGIDGIQGQIYDYLLAKGVPPVGAAAIMGNIQGESSFKPDVVNSIGCSGLCQWYKGRLDNLKKLAASKGKNWTDVECQLDYLWEELNNKYTKVRDVIMAADQESELEYATWYWGRYFEVFFLGDSFEATKGNTATRYKYAQHWYQEWQQHHTSGTTSSVAYAHASAEEKVKGLFPNGAPQTREQAESYLTTINVPITSKDGTKGTKGVRVHRAIAQDVYNACVAAQNSGFKIYDIGGYRTFGTDTAGKSGGLSYSQHCYGLAVDINPTENGQFKNGRATGNWFYDPGGNEYSIQANSILVTTFKSMGWGWGGEWNSSKDYMHFSFMGT